ncbi:hypothetical protein GCM10009623_29650 [Nocardioides aestuarii]
MPTVATARAATTVTANLPFICHTSREAGAHVTPAVPDNLASRTDACEPAHTSPVRRRNCSRRPA